VNSVWTTKVYAHVFLPRRGMHQQFSATSAGPPVSRLVQEQLDISDTSPPA